MNTAMTFDTKEFDIALKNINFSREEFLKIEGKGARVLVEGMQSRVARDTDELFDSIKPHIIEASESQIEDHVGPEAKHGPYQEFGTGIYAENGQGRQTPWVYRRKDGRFFTTQGNKPHPFIRPTVAEDSQKSIEAITAEFKRYLLTKWLK